AKQTDFSSRDSESKRQADSQNCVEIFFDSTTTEAKLFSGLPLREAVFIVKAADFFKLFPYKAYKIIPCLNNRHLSKDAVDHFSMTLLRLTGLFLNAH
ncbi:hypothetical protein, partial [Rodentibacter caecimuris]|uniref:hypothetical protein n=1 Tax=Rodentibacter caecimuris TaxID=1796644 RepID=UPI00195D23C0